MAAEQHRGKGREKGFTVLELLISTAVFSMVLLLLATAIVQIGRMFYKGVTINRTQDTARKVVNDVIGAVQYGEDSGNGLFHQKSVAGGITAECIGTIRYTYTLSSSLGSGAGQSAHVLWKDRIGASGSCTPSTYATGEEMLGPDMRLAALDVSLATGSSYKVNVTVATGATTDLFEVSGGAPDFSHCVSQSTGGQFCAVSSITSYATKRL